MFAGSRGLATACKVCMVGSQHPKKAQQQGYTSHRERWQCQCLVASVVALGPGPSEEAQALCGSSCAASATLAVPVPATPASSGTGVTAGESKLTKPPAEGEKRGAVGVSL